MKNNELYLKLCEIAQGITYSENALKTALNEVKTQEEKEIINHFLLGNNEPKKNYSLALQHIAFLNFYSGKT